MGTCLKTGAAPGQQVPPCQSRALPARGGRQDIVTATTHAVELTRIAAEAAADKLADAIIGYDVSEQLVITDVFLLCSARNDRQVRSIVDEIEERLRRAGAKPVRREGEREGRWVLLDYVDLVIHVQQEEERIFYALERLWKDCPRIPLAEPVAAGVARAGGAGGVGRVAGADGVGGVGRGARAGGAGGGGGAVQPGDAGGGREAGEGR
jgi:ribosome-associated protein